MNGISLAAELKQKYQVLELIILSPNLQVIGLGRQDNPLLTNPFSLNELTLRVHLLLNTPTDSS
jgi:DNA-binding response OmpR family regulator